MWLMAILQNRSLETGLVLTGLLIFCEKKSKISRDFQGQIRGKIGRFGGILAEKSQNLKHFQEQIIRKISPFHGKFRGKTSTSPRNNR